MDIAHGLLKAAGKTLFTRTSKPPRPRRIIVLKNARFGDFVNAMPALYVLRKTFRDARIVLLVLPAGGEGLEDGAADTGYLRLLDEGVVDETVRLGLPGPSGMGGLVRQRRKVKDIGADMAFVMPSAGEGRRGALKKLALLRALGVTKNVYGLTAGVDLLKDGNAHEIFGPLGALKEAGIEFDVERDVVFPVRRDRSATDYVGSIWKSCGLQGRDVVGIFPGSRRGHKRWPLERFARLVRGLMGRGAGVVLVGGNEDRFLCEWLSRSVSGKARNLAGRLDHLSLAEALRRCVLFIGSESDPGHLASAVGTPCITILPSTRRPGSCVPWNGRGLAVSEPAGFGRGLPDERLPDGMGEFMGGVSVERVLDLAHWQLGQKYQPLSHLSRSM